MLIKEKAKSFDQSLQAHIQEWLEKQKKQEEKARQTMEGLPKQ